MASSRQLVPPEDLNWQPNLFGSLVSLRPLAETDFESLFSAASDPKIWELHPEKERYKRERFEAYFRSGIDSKGALLILDRANGEIIGSSRYTNGDLKASSVVIGFTFLTRPYWGGAYNYELKTLMLNHAFQFVETVHFVIGRDNHRSRRAITKIGAIEVIERSNSLALGDLSKSVAYQIQKGNWAARSALDQAGAGRN